MSTRQVVRNDDYVNVIHDNVPGFVNITNCYAYKIDGLYFCFHSFTTEAHAKLLELMQAEISLYNEGGSITRDIIRKVLTLFFYNKCYTRLTALVASSNRQAQRLAKICGFTEEGRLREAQEGEDVIIYSLLRREYEDKYGQS